MESSILNKIEHVKMLLAGESSCSALSGNTAELREDLDQAKTQIGMTESLLKALSPSDSLEIFTKLEVPPSQLLPFLGSDLPSHFFLTVWPLEVNKSS